MKKTQLKIGIIAFIFVIQLLYLGLILRTHQSQYYFIPTVFMLVLGIVYAKLPLHDEVLVFDSKWVFACIPIAALITYWLNNELGLGAVFAAGIVGTLGSYLYLLKPESTYLRQIAAPIYCGAFIGMSSLHMVSPYIAVVIAGLISAIIFYLTKSLFVGVGGKLGTIAFVGVLVGVMLLELFVI